MQTLDIRQSAECLAKYQAMQEDQSIDRMSIACSAWKYQGSKNYKWVAMPGMAIQSGSRIRYNSRQHDTWSECSWQYFNTATD